MVENDLNDVDEYLNKLVAEACRHARGSREHQAKLNKIIRGVMESGYLWQENTPYYEDALQDTWFYLCDNAERYDYSRGTVLNWLNKYLKWRLEKLRISDWKAETISVAVQTARTEELDDVIGLNDEKTWNLPARPGVPLILEETRKWVETDSSGELRKTHIRERPDVNCQSLIMLRLPPEIKWKHIAQKFKLADSTAQNFYKREALPRLRKFGIRQGYLD